MLAMGDVRVFIDPFSYHFYRDGLFDPSSSQNRDQCLTPYHYLRERLGGLGIETHTADFLLRGESVGRVNVYFSLGIVENYRCVARRGDTILSGFFAVEAPINAPTMYRRLSHVARRFRRVFSYSDAASLRRFVGGMIPLHRFHIPQPFDAALHEYWENEDRRPLVLINANKWPRLPVQELYSERLRALEYFARDGGIDLYGFGWDRLPYPIGYGRVTGRLVDIGCAVRERLMSRWRRRYGSVIARAYRGTAASKYATLAQYRFAICFENMVLPGWVTEKIFDCLYVGTIPVYLGAPDIDRYVPADCFIDMRRFAGYEDLEGFLSSLEKKAVEGYRERARAYLSSEAFRPFCKEAFAEHFLQAVREDVGLKAEPWPQRDDRGTVVRGE